MNAIKEIARINQRELELGLAGKGSWHDEYKDSAYVFIGGLSYDLTEGDVITILSQFGEIVDINLPRDKTTGKTKGFGFVMYEDQRSTVLAVDNMNGAQVLGRTIRVDHCRKYNKPGEKSKEGEHVAPEEPTYNAMPPILDGSDDSESEESEDEPDNLDDEDPMAAFIRAEKKKEKLKAKGLTDGKRKRKHDGETREEKRARKEAKRAKKAAKEAKKGVKRERDEDETRGGGSLGQKEKDFGRVREREREDRYRDDRYRVDRERVRDGRSREREDRRRNDERPRDVREERDDRHKDLPRGEGRSLPPYNREDRDERERSRSERDDKDGKERIRGTKDDRRDDHRDYRDRDYRREGRDRDHSRDYDDRREYRSHRDDRERDRR